LWKSIKKENAWVCINNLLYVEIKGDGDGKNFLYYASKYCKLNVINDEDIENFKFMEDLSKYTKLNPMKIYFLKQWN